MKWIKASERLPKDSGYYCARMKSSQEKHVFSKSDLSHYATKPNLECEWLDESQEQQSGVFGEWQRCPICEGHGQILADGFTSNIYQLCPTCEGNRIIQKPIITSEPKQ